MPAPKENRLKRLLLGVAYRVKHHVNQIRLWRAIVRAVSRRELRLRPADFMRALTAANATLEQEIVAHRRTESELRTPPHGILGAAVAMRPRRAAAGGRLWFAG